MSNDNEAVEIIFDRFSKAEAWRSTANALAEELEEAEHKLGVALTLIAEYSDLPWTAATGNVAHGKDEGVSQMMDIIRDLEYTLNKPHIMEKLRIVRQERDDLKGDSQIADDLLNDRNQLLHQLRELFEAVRPHANVSKHIFRECEDTEKLLEKYEQEDTE